VSQRREQILTAARRVLIDEGSADFSVRKVAQAAGISLGNLQYYFPSRVALLDALLAQDVEEYERVMSELVRAEHTGHDALVGYLTIALNAAGDQEDQALFRALFTFREPEIARSLENYYHRLRHLADTALARIAGIPCDDPRVVRATSILLPFLDGFESTGGVLQLEPSAVAQTIADAVWSILTGDLGRAEAE
jgi:AcrR family transcriptional regulator